MPCFKHFEVKCRGAGLEFGLHIISHTQAWGVLHSPLLVERTTLRKLQQNLHIVSEYRQIVGSKNGKHCVSKREKVKEEGGRG